MGGRYEIRGSNTLYKVWGIITFVFAGIYALGRLASFVLLGIGGSILKASEELSYYGLGLYGYFDEIQNYFVIFILLTAMATIVGLIIRIFAGMYLFSPYVKSKGGMIAVAILYFLMALGNLIWVIIYGGLGSVAFVLLYLFCMGWAIATAVFLIMKQAAAVPGGYRVYDAQDSRQEGPYTRVSVDESVPYIIPDAKAESGLQANIEGLFGGYIGKKYILRPGESCRIGRDSGCDIQIHHAKVSRIHCAIKLLPDGQFEVTDYSSNGTFYENTALSNGVATIVKAGGMLVVGSADNVLSLNIC